VVGANALTCLALAAALGGCDGSETDPAGRAPAEPSTAEHSEPSTVPVPAGVLHTNDAVAHDIAAFRIDRAPVTRAAFESFVEATGHVTAAEREGDGNVLDLATGRWEVVPGASFRSPRGPDAEPAPGDHPATQLALSDAEAYCAWVGGRVPTELEWEHAARNGRDDRSAYPWGQDAYVEGRARANTWEGTFPSANTLRDGYLFTSPIDAYPPSPLGLRDIVGNVWQWTTSPFDVSAPDGARAIRGGSHLCDPDVCHGFRVDARQHALPPHRSAHVGARCVY